MATNRIIDYSRPQLSPDFFQLVDSDSGESYYTNNDSMLFIASMKELERGFLIKDHMLAVDEMVRMQYVQVRNILPLYGYQSSSASALVPGSIITQGMLVINKTNDIFPLVTSEEWEIIWNNDLDLYNTDRKKYDILV